MNKKAIEANILDTNVIGHEIETGTSEFNEIIRGNALYADKSLFIKDIIDNRDKAILITRPRRWGKTLNMSMLQHFFAKDVSGQSTAGLFDNLLINKVDDGKYMQHQGQYPVIFITFKDVKKNSLADIVYSIRGLINELFKEHYYLKNSDKIKIEEDKDLYSKYLTSDLNQDDVEKSLKFLSRLLKEHCGKEVYILIDEYDTPLNEAHNASEFSNIVTFMKNLLSNALKGNPYLEKGIMTGILRISKDSMLSGLNNLETYTVLDSKFKKHFGFTDYELDLLFKNQDLEKNEKLVKSWYNGYSIGGLTIYNPWSIMHCLKHHGEIGVYWVHTASDTMLRSALQNADVDVKAKLQRLILGDSINDIITESVRFDSLEIDDNTIWSLLLYTGHLTVTSCKPLGINYECDLRIPNKEITILYTDILVNWFGRKNMSYYGKLTTSLMNNLVAGEIETFANEVNNFLLAVASFHDYARDPEAFYHGFMLALSASLLDKYYIHSNKESGNGRPDLLLIPMAHTQNCPTTAVILEFKRGKKTDEGSDKKHIDKIEENKLLANAAIEQIEIKNYSAIISQHKYVTDILKVSLVFDGKHVEYAYKQSKVNLFV